MTSRGAPVSQLQLPRLADQVLAEAAVGLFSDQYEAGVLIDLAGGEQDALGPERDLAIAAGAREGDAFGDEALAEAVSASSGVDDEQPDFRDVVAMPHQEHRADRLAVDVGDPAAFPRGVERGQ